MESNANIHPTPSPLRVLIVEDHEGFRRFIRATLEQKAAVEIVGEAFDGLEAVRKAEELQPNLVLLDIGLPKLNGLEAGQQIRRLSPKTTVLFISQVSSAEVVREAFRSGACGYVHKPRAQSDLLPAVEAVLQNHRFVSGNLEFEKDSSRRTELADEIRLRYAAIVESSEDAIIAQNLQGVISAWNLTAQRMFGYSQEEALGQPGSIIIPPELHGEENDILTRLRAGERIEHYETQRVSKDGKRICVSITVSPIRDGNRIVGASSIIRDITERKRTEAALRESEERFRLAARSGRMYAFEWDVLADVIKRSGDSAEIVGADGLKQASSQQVWAQVYPDDRETLKAAVAKLTPEEPNLRISHRMVRQGGEVIFVERNCRAHFDKQGRMVRMAGMVTDVTEHKQTEAALQGSEELLRMATRSGKMFAYEWDATTDKIVRSQGVAEVLGLSEGTYTTGQHVLDMVPAEDRERLSHAIAELSPEKPFLHITYRMLRPDGTVIWLDRNSRAYFDRDSRLLRLIGMLTDVTDRVRTEQILCQKDRELSEAQRLARVGSWRWDARDDTVAWSEELYRIAGLDPALPVPPFSELLSRQFTPESRERLQRAVAAALKDRTSYELDLEVVRPDGGRRWIMARGEAVSDTAGTVVGLRGTSHDITERKLAEEALSKVSQKLIEAQEQERSRLARELHDDISQQLALLEANLESLRQNPPTSAEELSKQIGKVSERVEEIGEDIQALSHRLHSSKLEYLGLAAAAASFCSEFSARQQVDITFRSKEVPRQLPSEISICLFRVLQEAVQNATKHSGSRLFEVSLQVASNEIELMVRDSGIGFDPQEAFKGRGLGLASMKERLKLVSGELSIGSQLGHGTTIQARVPLGSEMKSAAVSG